ncbi:type II toxin-antitoxin system VapC family toxin [Dethiobacter alkaliphilus]|uniref:PilT protein domain protein n=1 Tax=Dethiobacter alkaliphilus AHT 1 TaxID=555088 RepID=C0GFC8_DETAL|nr:PIN domain nuclease [Dethiobacter alkaliphilus]EEG77888.1 PilT protein domain protein [Dethiobacter alkaliphilus AHT 1]
MVLVDTSVLISFLKGQADEKVELFKDVLSRDIPFGISSYTYQEVLQGARNEAEFNTLKEYLATQQIYYLKPEVSTYEKAARIYFDLRRKEVTTRSTIDILIALTAIENKLALLHNDNDFMSDYIPDLMVLNSL